MPVFIHNGLRTPIGVVNGQYKSMRPELLGAKVLNQLFDSVKASSLDAILWQCSWYWWKYSKIDGAL